MKRRNLHFGYFVFAFYFAVTSLCFAGLIDYDRLKKIQERRRLSAAAAQEQAQKKDEGDDAIPDWMVEDPKVIDKAEDVYDVNRDGKLQSVEVKILLRDVWTQVKEKGGYTVNMNILKEYDKNKDGLISRLEAEEIARDVR